MPIYEYRCSSCGFEKEYLQKVSDPRLTHCPECSKATFEKQVTAAGFQLKGSGWYATDFKNSGAKPPAAQSKSSADSDKAPANTEKPAETKKDEKSEPAGAASTSPANTNT